MNLTDKIKSINLAEVARTHVELRRHGNNFTGRCPLHDEKTPSFTVFEDNHFKCFGCGAHGDAADFVQSLNGVDFKGALRLLGIEQGSLSGADFKAIRKREQQRAQARKDKKREQALAYTLAFLIRSAHKALADITADNLNDYVELFDKLPFWEYCHEILCSGTDQEKLECCKQLKDMKTIKRNTLFKPSFDLGAWAKRSCNG
jgi:DNA primase